MKESRNLAFLEVTKKCHGIVRYIYPTTPTALLIDSFCRRREGVGQSIPQNGTTRYTQGTKRSENRAMSIENSMLLRLLPTSPLLLTYLKVYPQYQY